MQNNSKILIVNAPLKGSAQSANYALFPSLGIISLATQLKKDYPFLNIEIIDGGIFSTSQIIKKIEDFKPTILAISVLTPTYFEGLKIARYAKEKFKSVTILGNDHASFFPNLILQKKPFIDFVIKSEIGEKLLSLLIGYLIGEIKSLHSDKSGEDGIFYREENSIKRTYNISPIFSAIYKTKGDIPDLNFIRKYFHIYVGNYNNKYHNFHNYKKIPATINTARGCKNQSVRCFYCAIYDLRPKWTNPEFFWKIIEIYHEKFGINFFFEVADEFLTFQKFIKEIIKIKPFDLKSRGIEVEVYARTDEVLLPNFIEIAKQLNIKRVNLGLDSGDNEILKLLRKKLKSDNLKPLEINYQAVKLLAENNIQIHASFLIGCIGETKNSINNTLNFIKKIANDFKGHIVILEASELVPLPDSPCWDILLGKEKSKYYSNLSDEFKKAKIKINETTIKALRKKYENQDILDVKELSQDWIKYFTNISWKDVTMMKKEIKKIAEQIGALYGVNIGV